MIKSKKMMYKVVKEFSLFFWEMAVRTSKRDTYLRNRTATI